MEYVERGALLLSTPECVDKYLKESDFLNEACGKILLSKVLGYAVVAGSIFIKVPQILKMIGSSSSQGISFIAQLLDVLAITFNMCYAYMSGFPFSTWGDSVFNFLQTLTITSLCLVYTNRTFPGILVLLSGLALPCYLSSGMVPLSSLGYLNNFNILLLLFSRGTQILTNFFNGGTGQLSLITTILLFGGALARIFTSIQETGDANLIRIFMVSAMLNGTVVMQILYYWNAKPVKIAGSKQRSKKTN